MSDKFGGPAFSRAHTGCSEVARPDANSFTYRPLSADAASVTSSTPSGSLAFGVGGQRLYIANPGQTYTSSGYVSGYAVDPTSGGLTPLSGSPFGFFTEAGIAMTSDEKSAYGESSAGGGGATETTLVGYARKLTRRALLFRSPAALG